MKLHPLIRLKFDFGDQMFFGGGADQVINIELIAFLFIGQFEGSERSDVARLIVFDDKKAVLVERQSYARSFRDVVAASIGDADDAPHTLHA